MTDSFFSLMIPFCNLAQFWLQSRILLVNKKNLRKILLEITKEIYYSKHLSRKKKKKIISRSKLIVIEIFIVFAIFFILIE